MANFLPHRASPLPRHGLARTPRDINPLQESRSASMSVPELVGLTSEEIEFIDMVVERASPTATTFLTVLKVYNDLLQERGIDPQNEVVYFGKLLKLGTVKGKNWREKWDIVKDHHGYRSQRPQFPHRMPPRSDARASTASPPKFARRFSPPDPEIDTFTIDSHPEDTKSTEIGTSQYHATPRAIYRRSQSPVPSTAASPNSLGLDLGLPASYPSTQTFRTQLRRPLGSRKWDVHDSDDTDFAPTQVSTPPSYGAALRDSQHDPIIPSTYTNFRARHIAGRPQVDINTKSSVLVRRDSVINEEEAWNKVKMLRDEEDADRFRKEKLVERCWDVWIQGCQWIKTTNEQIAAARDMLILRVAMQRWRARTASRLEYISRVDALSNGRCLKTAFNIWKSKLQAKRQAQWRDAMRNKMKVIRTKREGKLKKDAWAKWRQSYQSHLSGQHYNERLVHRFFQRWQRRLMELDHLEAIADDFSRIQEDKRLVRYWSTWRRWSELRTTEKILTERVDLRIMSSVLHAWKRHMRDATTADAFYDKVIKRRTLRSWQTALGRIQAQEHRATRHLARQDDILIRAVMRVWKSHERGKLLARVRMVRLLKQSWSVWRRRLRQQRDREDLALAFSTRQSSTVVLSSLQVWRRIYATHQNAAAFAAHYHSAQLSFKMMVIWRLRLREKLKTVKQARIAEKFLLVRRMWKHWKTRLQYARLEQKLKTWNTAKVQMTFEQWFGHAQRQKQLRLAEQTMQQRVALRILSATLADWTNRVADIKFRELETSQSFENRVMIHAFTKWKTLCIRHVEELSLMQSYQDIKREENMRRMFYKWLTSARTARHRRVTLQLREEEMKHSRLAIAWEKWRGRFRDIQLQPLADGFITQRQTNLVFFAFGRWHSKTRSLPALRFHALHVKRKAWKVWRNAMPRALQSKRARELERRSVLAKAFDKWQKNYRTKIALKAIARARYLRLPVTAPRQTAPQSRARPVQSTVSRTVAVPRNDKRSPSLEHEHESETGRGRPSHSFTARPGIASLLISKTAPPENHPMSRPKLSSRGSNRDLSPARSRMSIATPARGRSPSKARSAPPSSAGREGGASRLLQELREARRRSRPSTDRSLSPS